MSAEEKVLTFGLDGGMNETALPEVVQPPSLIASYNTRLNINNGAAIKCPELTALTAYGTTGKIAGGIVPLGKGDSSALYMLPAKGQKRIVGVAASSLVSGLTNGVQNAYFPAQVTASGVAGPGYPVDGSASSNTASTVVNQGVRYVATVTADLLGTSHYYAYFNVFDEATGALRVSQYAVDLGTTYPLSIALTSHDTSGVCFWYFVAGTGIKMSRVSLSFSTLTVAAATTVYAARSTCSLTAAFASGGSGTGDSTYGYVWCGSNTTDTDMILLKVLISNGSVASSNTFPNMVNGASGNVLTAIDQMVINGTNYVSLALSNAGTNLVQHMLVNGGTMSTVWSGWTTEVTGTNRPVAVHLASIGSWVGQVLAVTYTDGDVGTSSTSRTVLYFRTTASTPVLTSTVTVPWHRLHSFGATLYVSATEVYPLFPMQQCYQAGAVSTSYNYTQDPSYEVYMPAYDATNGFVLSTVARVGVDAENTGVLSHIAHATGSKLHLLYRTNPIGVATHQYGTEWRYVTVSFAGGQCRYAHDDAGGTVVAAAQPAYWDGQETTEYGPLHAPAVTYATTGGTGGSGLTGSYSWIAIYVWRDALGQWHRSGPSVAATHTFSNTKPIVYVTKPVSMRNGTTQQSWAVELYQKGPSDSAYTQILASSDAVLGPSDKSTNLVWAYDVTTGANGGKTLYSTGGIAGEELIAEAPPPAWDACVVNKRCWIIDAEHRNRAVYSKLKQDGIAFEFNGALEVLFPAAAGKLVAISEVNGSPVFFTETGVYVVQGPGPDNTGAGVDFADPRRISDYGCTDRNSVVRTPAGVLFMHQAASSYGRFFLFGNDGSVTELGDIEAAVPATAGLTFRFGADTVFTTSDSSFPQYTWNYKLARWSKWTHLAGAAPTAAAFVPSTQVALMFNGAEVYMLDPSSPSSSQQIYLQTGWIAPAGLQSSCTIREIVLLSRRWNAHGLTVTVYQDYETDADHTQVATFTTQQVTDATNSNGETTLRIKLKAQASRAVQLVIQETGATGAGYSPISASILYGVDPGVNRRQFQSGLK